MVVEQVQTDPSKLLNLDVGYLGGFLGLRMNELVMEAIQHAGFKDVRESHGYVLQHFIDSDRGITELARRMEVTQQAASKAVAEIVAIGLLEECPSRDRRSRRVRLSEQGWRFVRTTRRTRSKLERKLLRAVGQDAYDNMRKTLIQCLEELGRVDRILSRRVRAPR
jgi:DNA-binding MarR family transcriptional regulator